MRRLTRALTTLIFLAAIAGAIALAFVEPPATTRVIETEATLPAAEDAR